MFPYAIIFFSLTVFMNGVNGHADGAPCSQYQSMYPSRAAHGEDSNDGKPAPYDVVLLDRASNQEASCYAPGKSYTVKIQPKSSDTIKGFVIQGRDANDKPVGKFDEGGYVKYQCPDKIDSVTHKSSDDKSNVEATWSTDAEAGTLIFKATIVQKLTNYYVQVPSKPVTVCK